MGVRIHKAIGYGITDRKTNKATKITTLLRKSFSMEKLHRGEEGGFKRFGDWLTKKSLQKDEAYDRSLTLALLKLAIDREESLPELIVFNPMESTMSTLVLIPPGFENFSRAHDSIDYVEWKQSGKPLADSVKFLQEPLPSFEQWMDARTGRFLDLEFCEQHQLGGATTKAYQQNGFASPEEMHRYCVPNVPRCIRWFAEYIRLFQNPQTILALRPMLYTYWC